MASLTDITGRSRVVPGLGPGFGLAAAILAMLTVIRLVGLKLSVVDLFFDEAQYWTWSRELAFGYFSKPPLLAYVRLLASGGARWPVVLGVALGLGLMAKYAMIYFLLGVALAAWLDQDARRLLGTPPLWLALVIAAVIVAPNILWNLHNDL